MPASNASGNRPRSKLGRNVVTLGVVSLLTDASTEMIYPLLPIFLTTTLGASTAMLGVIEGVSETIAGVLKLLSGNWSDQAKRRKPLIVTGYAISSIMRPLIAAATTPWHILAIRVSDRVGKGIRTSPRDALIADSTDTHTRGRAYGFHRAMDHLGAVIGPLIAFALLNAAGFELRTVFWLAAIPGALSVVVLVAFVRELPKAATSAKTGFAFASWGRLPGTMKRYLAILLLFTLSASSDAFLLLRAADLGVSVALVPVLWSVHHMVKSAMSTPAGALSDRVGRRPLIVAGWLLYALVYLAFGLASEQWHAWALFIAYGAFYALTEGAEKAFVADLVPADIRGNAFGWFNLMLAIGALPASVMFGVLWKQGSPMLAFGVSAAIALTATALMMFLAVDGPTKPEPETATAAAA